MRDVLGLTIRSQFVIISIWIKKKRLQRKDNSAMKKIIALALAFAMIFSFSALAFAAETHNINPTQVDGNTIYACSCGKTFATVNEAADHRNSFSSSNSSSNSNSNSNSNSSSNSGATVTVKECP